MAGCVDGYVYPFSLRRETTDWIDYYCKKIYVYHESSFKLPPSVVEELSRVKKCEGSGVVYRGMSFSFINYDKFRAFYNAIDPVTRLLEINSTLPISTSKDIEIARGFTANYLFGLLLTLQVPKEDILVDLTLLDGNTTVDREIYNIEEREVILLPGSYKMEVLEYDMMEENMRYGPLYDILSPYIRGKRILNATVTSSAEGVTLTTPILSARFSFHGYKGLTLDIGQGSRWSGDETILHLSRQDIIISSGNSFKIEGDVLEFVAENVEELFGDKGVVTKRPI